MRKKKILVVIVIVVLPFVLFIGYKLATFRLFDVQLNILKDLNVPNKEYRMRIYYLPSNASSQSYIQVRKYTHDNEYVLKNYEKYNYLKECYIEGDSVYLFLADTSKTKYEIELKKILLPIN